MATEAEMRKFVNDLSVQIDRAINGPELPGIQKQAGFVLIIFPMGAPPDSSCTFATNGLPKEFIAELLKAQAALMEPKAPAN